MLKDTLEVCSLAAIDGPISSAGVTDLSTAPLHGRPGPVPER